MAAGANRTALAGLRWSWPPMTSLINRPAVMSSASSFLLGSESVADSTLSAVWMVEGSFANPLGKTSLSTLLELVAVDKSCLGL